MSSDFFIWFAVQISLFELVKEYKGFLTEV